MGREPRGRPSSACSKDQNIPHGERSVWRCCLLEEIKSEKTIMKTSHNLLGCASHCDKKWLLSGMFRYFFSEVLIVFENVFTSVASREGLSDSAETL